MSYQIAIVEDEYFIAEDLKAILEKSGFEVIGIATTYQEAIVLCAENNPDLLLIDIHLNDEKNGLDLARVISEKYHLPFIFITSFSDKKTVEQAKDLHPLSYLVKPFNERNVVMAVEIGMTNMKGQDRRLYDEIVQQDYFFVSDRKMMKKVRFEEVLFLESDDNYSFIHTEVAKFIVYASRKSCRRSSPTIFERIHRSYIINLNLLNGIRGEEVILQDETKLPIGRTYKRTFLYKLNFLSK